MDLSACGWSQLLATIFPPSGIWGGKKGGGSTFFDKKVVGFCWSDFLSKFAKVCFYHHTVSAQEAEI